MLSLKGTSGEIKTQNLKKGEIYEPAFIPAGPAHQGKHSRLLLHPSASIYQGKVFLDVRDQRG